MMKKLRIIFVFIILFIVMPGSYACAKVYIDIDSPAFQKFPVAIPDFVPFEKQGSSDDAVLSQWFSDRLSELLSMTGYFRILNKGAFLEEATAEYPHFQSWRSIGADFLIKGKFKHDEHNLSVEFRLYDVVEGRLITGKKYWGKFEERQAMIFRFIEEILLALTGSKGVFDTKIAFVGQKGKCSEIYVVNFDNSGFRKVTNLGSLNVVPKWSPDGRALSFTSYITGNPNLYRLELPAGKIQEISNYRGLNLSGPWSPDGKRLLVVLSKDGNEEIYIKDFSSGALIRLTWDPSIDVSPSWSPDGKKIAFVSNRSGSPQIFIMDVDGKNVRRLTFEGSYNTSPSWSPEGKRIVYEGATGGRFQLFTISEDGTGLMQLTFEEGGAESPSWSPDGRYLVFHSRRGGKEKICIINSNGLNLRELSEIKGVDNVKYPSWSPHLN